MALDRHPTGDRDRSRDDRTIVHVSAFPPTPSGVGLYSQVFDEVLSRFGAVTRIVAPADPRESQSLGEALRGLMLGLGPRLRDVDLVHIELSGRALFQFYVALGLSVGRRRSLLAITGHDAPSLTGWVFLFRELDRRPFRRLAGRASSVLGRRVEWFVLTRCDAVLALTREGAESLRLLAGSAHALPHVVDGTAPWAKEPRVFVPGYVSDADTVVALVAEVARHAAASGVPWRVAVGSTDPHTQSEVEGRLGPSERAIVGFTGHLDEDRLLAEFDRAFVVVRAVGTDQHNAFAASGPLSWAASRGCLCLTNDARSGARELADEGLVLRSDSLASDLGALLAEWPDEPGVGLRFARAQSVLGIDAVAQRYGVVLAEAEQRHHVRASSPA